MSQFQPHQNPRFQRPLQIFPALIVLRAKGYNALANGDQAGNRAIFELIILCTQHCLLDVVGKNEIAKNGKLLSPRAIKTANPFG